MQAFLDNFHANASRFGARCAMQDDTGAVSYAQLDGASNALATALLHANLPQDTILGFFKSSMVGKMLVAIGCIKAGIPYVVLEQHEETSKRDHILAVAGVTHALVETDESAELARDLGLSVIQLDRNATATPPNVSYQGTQLVWLEPTSGSSGKPKLVGVDRDTLQHYLSAQARYSEITEDDSIANFGEVWLDTFLVGPNVGATAQHYNLRKQGTAALEQWMHQHAISATQTYTAAFRTLAGAVKNKLPALKNVRLAGELLKRSDVVEFERICPADATLSNYLGSTECSFVSQHKHQVGDNFAGDALPVGQIIDGTTIEIHDKAGNTLPKDRIGVVVVKSKFMATGYYKNPEQTKGVYWQEPDGTRVLNTGDLGQLSSDNHLTLLGRADDQVKIRGYSVRYSEIEAALEKIPGLQTVGVTSHLGPTGIRYLSAHYEGPKEFASQDLKQTASGLLPSYMVPNYYLHHNRLPRTGTNKVLRRKLPDPTDLMDLKVKADQTGWTAEQQAIANIWTKYLGHSNFGLDDDFFDVGGDSLHAMEMLMEVERFRAEHIGYENLILEGSSIRDITRFASKPASDIVTLHGSDSDLAIYVLPVENGEFSPWLQVCNALPALTTVFGVQYRDGNWQNGIPVLVPKDCGETAAQKIMEHAAGKDFVVAGYSAGAQTALETARALQRSGSPAKGLILLDPTLPKHETYRKSWKLRRIFSPLIKRGELMKSINRAAHILLGLPAKEPFIADERLFYSYDLKPGHVTPAMMIMALEENPARDIKEAAWTSCVDPNAELHRLACNHQNIVRNDNAVTTAAHISNWIARLN